MSRKDFKEIRLIGRGNVGKVYLVRLRGNCSSLSLSLSLSIFVEFATSFVLAVEYAMWRVCFVLRSLQIVCVWLWSCMASLEFALSAIALCSGVGAALSSLCPMLFRLLSAVMMCVSHRSTDLKVQAQRSFTL